MIVRQMQIGDYERVHALWKATPGVGLNAIDDSREGIAKYLARNPNTCFVAENGDRLLGAILCSNDGRRGYIHHTAVAASEQRSGIGTALLNAAMDALDGEGIIKVALVAFADNETGNAFWQKQGFVARSDLVYRNKFIREPEGGCPC